MHTVNRSIYAIAMALALCAGVQLARAEDAAAPAGKDLARENARLKAQVAELEARNSKLFKTVKDLEMQVQHKAPEVPADKKDALKKSIHRLVQFADNYYDNGDYKGAWPLFKSAVDLGSDDPEALFRLGYCFSFIAEYKEAATYYRMAAEGFQKANKKSRLLDTYNNLAVILERQDNAKEAVEALKKVLELDPDYASAWYNLGALYEEKLKQPDEAVKAFRRHIVLAGARSVSAENAIKRIQEKPAEGTRKEK